MTPQEIEHEPAKSRFILPVEGKEAVLSYRIEGELLDIYRTYTPEELRGQGIAGKLVEKAFAYAKENGYKVRPSCPYVAAYMERHEEHQDLKA